MTNPLYPLCFHIRNIKGLFFNCLIANNFIFKKRLSFLVKVNSANISHYLRWLCSYSGHTCLCQSLQHKFWGFEVLAKKFWEIF